MVNEFFPKNKYMIKYLSDSTLMLLLYKLIELWGNIEKKKNVKYKI